MLLPLLATAVLGATAQPRAQDCCDPAGPFTLGEDYPEKPATCETIAQWMPRAPKLDARISLGIVGKLAAVNFDGALAYLVMCEPSGVQVMCITYSTNGLKPGDSVLFAGGYRQAGERQIVLDPCLASSE
jgi:hypothetical protein